MSELSVNENIKCEVCGKEFKRISPSHLKSRGMTYDDYRKQYPGAPLTSPGLKARIKYTKTHAFKEDEVTEQEAEDLDKLLIEKLKKESDLIIDEIRDDKVEIKEIKFQQKKELFDIIKKFFPDIRPDFEIKKFNFQNKLESVIITDMACPNKKIDFEFVNTFWHNPGFFYLTPQREQILKSMGWKVVIIKENAPSKEQIIKICEELLLEIK